MNAPFRGLALSDRRPRGPGREPGQDRVRDRQAGLLDIAAPIVGGVVSLRAVQGEAVQATAPLFTIADTRTIWLWIDVFESEIGWVREGQSVDFLVPDSEAPAASGTVTWIGTEVNLTTRTTRVRAELANPEGKVRANQFGKARLRIGEVHPAVVVPSGAVQRWENDQYVFLPRARRSRATRHRLFTEGQESMATFLNAQWNYQDVVRLYLDALILYRRSMLRLNTAVGQRIFP